MRLQRKKSFMHILRSMIRWYYVVQDEFPLSCLYDLPLKYVDQNIRLLAVNAQTEKKIPSILQDYVIHEKELDWYNPFLQYNNFKIDSAYYHVAKNPSTLLEPFKYVGFITPQSKLTVQALQGMEKKITENMNKKLLFFSEHEIGFNKINAHIGIHGWEKIVKKYNTMYGTSHDITRVLASMIPMKNIFSIPQDILLKMIDFAERTVPILFEELEYKTDLLPYHNELLYSIFLMMQGWDGYLHELVKLPIHDV